MDDNVFVFIFKFFHHKIKNKIKFSQINVQIKVLCVFILRQTLPIFSFCRDDSNFSRGHSVSPKILTELGLAFCEQSVLQTIYLVDDIEEKKDCFGSLSYWSRRNNERRQNRDSLLKETDGSKKHFLLCF